MMQLEARDIRVGYGERTVLDGVTVRCASGAFVGLIGPNGCGKSTLLRVLSGVLRPWEGAVWLDGQALTSLTPRDIARRLAFVPQSESAAFAFTVQDVVLMGRYPHRSGLHGPTTADYREVERALVATDLLALRSRPITELSGGEHRRVLLARALAQQTPLLLLDEPTAHLDITHQVELLQLAQNLAHPTAISSSVSGSSGSDSHSNASPNASPDSVSDLPAPVGVLAALHDVNQAAEFCDHLVLLHAGRVLVQGTPEEVLQPEPLRVAYQADTQIGTNPITGRPMLLALRPVRSGFEPLDNTGQYRTKRENTGQK